MYYHVEQNTMTLKQEIATPSARDDTDECHIFVMLSETK